MAHSVKEKTETTHRLVKNSIWLFAAETVAKLAGLGTQIVAARYLGEKDYGVFSLAFASTGALILFVDTGLGVYLTREVSRQRDKALDYLHNIFALKWGLTLLSVLVLAAVFSQSALDEKSFMVVATIAAAWIVNGYTDMCLSTLRGVERMSPIAKLMIFQRAAFFVLGVIVLLLEYKVVAFAITFLSLAVVTFFLALWQVKVHLGREKFRVDFRLIRRIFKESYPICGIGFFTFIAFRIDAVMIFFMLGDAKTGWYAAAFKLIDTLIILIVTFRSALLPVLSRVAAGGQADWLARIWREVVRYLLMVSIPLATGMVLLAHAGVALLYGPLYGPAGPVLQILAIAFPLLCLNEFAGYLLISADRIWNVLIVGILSATLNVVLNYLFIAKWGITGAAMVSVLTQLFIFALYFAPIRKVCGKAGALAFTWRPLMASAAMGWMLVAFATLPLGLTIFMAVVVYLMAMVLLQAFKDYDYLVLRKIFSRGSLQWDDEGVELPPASKELSIIIVNYKSMDYLKICLGSIRQTASDIDHEIIVVDNHSDDGSIEILRSDFPDVTLFANGLL